MGYKTLGQKPPSDGDELVSSCGSGSGPVAPARDEWEWMVVTSGGGDSGRSYMPGDGVSRDPPESFSFIV